jgi:uncharacterized protein (DUF2336 family)
MESELKDNLSNPITRPIDASRSGEAERRQTVIRVMTDLFIHDDGNLSDRERSLHEDVLEGLIGEAGMTLRKEVAERFANLRYAPKKVVQFLASDDIAVARTILTHSPALSDADLVDVVNNATTEHRVAIASRPHVDNSLISALIIAGEDDVFEAIARNPGAKMDEVSLTRIAARSQHNAGLAEALTTREDLKAGALSGLFWSVSATMREKIIDLVSPAAEFSGGLERAPIRLSSDAERETALAGLASLLTARKKDAFQHIMAQLLGISHALMGQIMSDTEGEPFAIACKAAGFRSESFTTLLLLYNPTVSESIKRVFALSELYERISPAAGWHFLHIWNRGILANDSAKDMKLKPAIHDQVVARSSSIQRKEFEQKVAEQAATIGVSTTHTARRTEFGRRVG